MYPAQRAVLTDAACASVPDRRPRLHLARSKPSTLRPAVLSRGVRDRLVIEHLLLVTRIARRLKPRLPAQVSSDDLCSAGHLGLVEASRRYCPTRGVAFGAFARRRILGAMLDHLRSIDMLTRDERRKSRAGHLPFFEVQLGYPGQPGVQSDLDRCSIVASASAEAARADLLRDDRVKAAIDTLRPRARIVLIAYFWEDQTLEQIGTRLGVTASAVAKTKAIALRRLQAILAV